MKVLMCLGTRPELIKMSTVIKMLRKSKKVECIVCLSGQHRELAENVISELGIQINYNLDVMKENQTLQYILAIVVEKLRNLIRDIKPDYIIVHGDTSTCFASAVCSFYEHIPIIYVEAGWRSNDKYTPFPEEMHRRLVSQMASYFLCSTENNYNTLISEGIDKRHIFITGNPISDILHQTLSFKYYFSNTILNEIVTKKYVLLTFHRRENRNRILDLYKIICKIAQEKSDIEFIWMCHPSIKERLDSLSLFDEVSNLSLLFPLGVYDMHNLIYRTSLIMTDSGGIQEEAYILNKPIIILREGIERIELLNEHSVISDLEEDVIRKHIDLFLKDVSYNPSDLNLPMESISSRIVRIIEGICYGEYG